LKDRPRYHPYGSATEVVRVKVEFLLLDYYYYVFY